MYDNPNDTQSFPEDGIESLRDKIYDNEYDDLLVFQEAGEGDGLMCEEEIPLVSAPPKHRNSRARHLSELTEQAAASSGLLISESGQAFAYQKG